MKKTIITLAAIMLLGCSDPKSTLISTAQADKEKMQSAMQKLSEEDRKLVASYLVRSTMANAFAANADPFPTGVTIADAIKQQKEWQEAEKIKEAEAAALKKKLDAEAEALRHEVESAVVVTVLGTKVRPKNYEAGQFSDVQLIRVGFENKSTKDIAGIEGQMAFYDIFDKEVGSISLSFDHGIKAGETAILTGSREINQFNPEHMALANLQADKYTTKFKPRMLVYADGTKLKMKNDD